MPTNDWIKEGIHASKILAREELAKEIFEDLDNGFRFDMPDDLLIAKEIYNAIKQKWIFSLYKTQTNDDIISIFNERHGHRKLTRTNFDYEDHTLYSEINSRGIMDKVIPPILRTIPKSKRANVEVVKSEQKKARIEPPKKRKSAYDEFMEKYPNGWAGTRQDFPDYSLLIRLKNEGKLNATIPPNPKLYEKPKRADVDHVEYTGKKPDKIDPRKREQKTQDKPGIYYPDGTRSSSDKLTVGDVLRKEKRGVI